ncbi:hypothetical protein GOODEAATRI_007269 [Goodea atripinnis]|uniref:Uncharacterized protein n=1 Tax=Goodea atripinnis TaxID=208336 RepID=A0ABV0PLP6_9TELE
MVIHGRAAGQHVCWVALACLSRLLASRCCSWTRLSFSELCPAQALKGQQGPGAHLPLCFEANPHTLCMTAPYLACQRSEDRQPLCPMSALNPVMMSLCKLLKGTLALPTILRESYKNSLNLSQIQKPCLTAWRVSWPTAPLSSISPLKVPLKPPWREFAFLNGLQYRDLFSLVTPISLEWKQHTHAGLGDRELTMCRKAST